MIDIAERRKLLKANFLELSKITTDQQNGIEPPLLEKPVSEFIKEIELPYPDLSKFSEQRLTAAITNRRSQRKYREETLELDELSYLLWATQGVKEVFVRNDKAIASFRTVPSAGARHPFETYLVILNVKGLDQGIYKYSSINKKLYLLRKDEEVPEKIVEATLGQTFTGKSSVVFVWSAIPYRAEWRYSISAQKAILLDAGHVCQNLYLACEEIGCGTCAIAAYDQEKMDNLLELDGEDEMVVYLSPVGKL